MLFMTGKSIRLVCREYDGGECCTNDVGRERFAVLIMD